MIHMRASILVLCFSASVLSCGGSVESADSPPVVRSEQKPTSHEPPGFVTLAHNPWDTVIGNQWNYLRRGASKDSDIVSDPTSPGSPSNVLRMIYTTDMPPDSEPGVHWRAVPSAKEIYTSWWLKASANWQCSPAGCGKQTFLFTEQSGQVHTGLYHPCAGPEQCSPAVNGPPFKLAVNTEWAPYGQKIWYPNFATTLINANEWAFVEVYYKWSTSNNMPNGIIRFWVNGVLNGNHTNVSYPAGSFIEFQYAPTTQNVPTQEYYLYLDDTHLSLPRNSSLATKPSPVPRNHHLVDPP
jgi:hypothetical protein